MEMADDIKYWIWLSSLVKISLKKRLRLLKHFTNPAGIWEAGKKELEALGFCTPHVVNRVLDMESRRAVNSIIEKVRRCNAKAIALNDPCYPGMLKHIADPPIVLYCRGSLAADDTCVSVVGSRRATPYGIEMARKLSSELARHGITIVSGLARGIDSKAHLGALEAGGRTIAVLGCGVDVTYPPENRALMERIIQSGAVISEYLPGVEPAPYNFPARNRIISGLSLGVAIVEAGDRSGSLITADFALEQGRDVYAVPGNINSANSVGTNRLIRDGALIVTCAGDILDELNIGHSGENVFCRARKLPDASVCGMEPRLGEEGRTIARKLEAGPAHIDAIARDCGINVQLASAVLMMLELSGFVEQLPGKIYKMVE